MMHFIQSTESQIYLKSIYKLFQPIVIMQINNNTSSLHNQKHCLNTDTYISLATLNHFKHFHLKRYLLSPAAVKTG